MMTKTKYQVIDIQLDMAILVEDTYAAAIIAAKEYCKEFDEKMKNLKIVEVTA